MGSTVEYWLIITHHPTWGWTNADGETIEAGPDWYGPFESVQAAMDYLTERMPGVDARDAKISAVNRTC